MQEVILWTSANYKTEDEFIFEQVPDRTNIMEDIKKALKKLDDITLYNFTDSVNQKNDLRNQPYLKIAFFDNFENSL